MPSFTQTIAPIHFRSGNGKAVFQSDYTDTNPGQTEFSGQFNGLDGTTGSLTLQVFALPIGGGNASIVAQTQVSLQRLQADEGRWKMRFDAKPGMIHSIRGATAGSVQAMATSLDISVDIAADGSAFSTALNDARKTVFAKPSEVGRNWWRRDSAVDRADLVSDAPATLADPSSQMCTAAQMEEPAFHRWAAALQTPVVFHRKLWEFVYILAVLEAQGKIAAGMRGLGFGCGVERLPALFAAHGCTVVATDMPPELQESQGWIGTNQHAVAIDQMQHPDICPPETFAANVAFRPVDMNDIPVDLTGFDFCWSACAYEHLGSIEAGLAFVRNSVACLKEGGVAVHTSELNLLSNDETIDNLSTVLFRRRDMERLALELTRDGHRVLPLKYDQGDRPLDLHVDVPPFSDNEHLRLALGQFVSTSFGIVVIKGGA